MTLDEAIKHAENVADYDCYNEEQFKCSEEHRQLAEWLRELKKLREQTRWIPVSKRLPKDKTYVLVTIAVRGRQPHSRSSWYQTGAFHNDNGDYWRADEPEVVAWMPLPEPYKAESEDKS